MTLTNANPTTAMAPGHRRTKIHPATPSKTPGITRSTPTSSLLPTRLNSLTHSLAVQDPSTIPSYLVHPEPTPIRSSLFLPSRSCQLLLDPPDHSILVPEWMGASSTT